MESIGSLFVLNQLSIETEWLSRTHAVDFIEAHVHRLIPVHGLARIPARLLGPVLARAPGLRRSIQGYSLLGVYRKVTR